MTRDYEIKSFTTRSGEHRSQVADLQVKRSRKTRKFDGRLQGRTQPFSIWILGVDLFRTGTGSPLEVRCRGPFTTYSLDTERGLLFFPTCPFDPRVTPRLTPRPRRLLLARQCRPVPTRQRIQGRKAPRIAGVETRT